ncbi:MAG TPA: aminopeptidase [Verrucomicrobiae bacterium]|nr:aminopeptidase [Verrucomicrobiae bacterium]
MFALTGCRGIGYYAQAVRGHLQIVHRAKPIEAVLTDPKTSGPLKERLRLVLDLRAFAERELGLPANGHYLRYADIGRRFAVWNVYAAPEFSLEAKTWWYPVVGSLEYQGHFAEDRARRYAVRLERKGFDVFVGGVQAYSTLGWFRDPVLNTFVHDSDADLAEVLFHELAHQRLFVASDTDFNEAFATAVAEEGVRRWLGARGHRAALEDYELDLRRKEQFVVLVSKARDELATLYAGLPAVRTVVPAKGAERLATRMDRGGESMDVEARRTAKRKIIDGLRRDYERLKAEWGGYDGYDGWFRLPINNAQVNDVDTYYAFVPAFQALLKQCDGDLGRFYKEVSDLAKTGKEERHARVRRLLDADR